MQQINVPRTNSNDDNCVLQEWVPKDGQSVEEGDVLAYLETSKANVEIVSPAAGIFHRLAEADREYETGTCIGYLFADRQEYEAFLRKDIVHEATEESPALILTHGAQELVAKHGVTEAQLRSLGKKLLKKEDILAVLGPPQVNDPASQPRYASRNQAAIAKQVTLSHQTIPSAFAAIKIYCDEMLKAISAYIENAGIVIGLADVFVKVLGNMHQEYPSFYQNRASEGEPSFSSPTSPGIGVTMDVGTGLYIPVVKEAAIKSLANIAEDLMGFRMKALGKTFSEEELSGGHLTISLHTNPDIIAAIPIVFPTQSCIVSICSEQEELYLAADGSVQVRRYCNVGIAYDHRLINGAEAVQFLQAIKQRIESNAWSGSTTDFDRTPENGQVNMVGLSLEA